ncbi:hypothetical protein [Maribacter sp.]|nr:hypothetical protein [Maribacter sp.]HDZ04891.1 hypothetical protein [Maribacter sp.]
MNGHMKMFGTYPGPALIEYSFPNGKGRCKILWANKMAHDLIQRKDLIGLNASELIVTPGNREFAMLMQKALTELEIYKTATFEYQYIRGDGELIKLRTELFVKYNHFLRYFFKINKLVSIMGYTVRAF